MRAIGVDLGGTKLAMGALVGAGGIEVDGYTEQPLSSVRYDDLLEVIADGVRGLCHGETPPLGVAVAAWLDVDRGRVLRAANLGWDDRALARDLAALTGLETTLHNDANCAAWGEYVLAGRPADGAYVTLTLGTDVGGGVVVNGRLLTGAFGIAGELGHLRVRADGPPCVCGSDGCLAVYASGTAMLKQFRQLTGDPSATAAELSEQARQGLQSAIQVVTEAATAIALASAQISRVIDHQALILGGGASGIGVPLAEAVREAILATEPVGPIRAQPDVLLARAGNRAGVLGAADLAALEATNV